MKPTLPKVAPIVVEGFDSDPELVENGAPVGLGRNPDGSQRFALVKPFNRPSFQNRLAARLKKYSSLELKSDPEVGQHETLETIAELGFVGGGNLFPAGSFEQDPETGAWSRREGAEPLKLDLATRRAMLEEPNFREQITQAGTMMETFRRQRAEESLGNSPKSSIGG